MYRNDIRYKRSGFILSDIHNDLPIQQNLFDEVKNRMDRRKLMAAIDNLNQRYGVKSIRLGIEGTEKQAWHVKSEHRSGNYLTDITEILTIKV